MILNMTVLRFIICYILLNRVDYWLCMIYIVIECSLGIKYSV